MPRPAICRGGAIWYNEGHIRACFLHFFELLQLDA